MKPSTRAAVDAAVAVARAHGVNVRDPMVIRTRANVIVHLRPAPVVARVASTTAVLRRHPEANLAREIAVVTFLVARGAAVVPPADELPPGPHEHRGRVFTFWRYVEHDATRVVGDADLDRSLYHLHRVLADYDGPLPYLSPALLEPLEWLDRLEEAGIADAATATALRVEVDACRRAIGTPSPRAQPLHGDAHRGNLLATETGLLWTDFEETCRGPVEWDDACDHVRPRTEAYAARDPFGRARQVQGVVWALAAAARDDGRLDAALDALGT